MVKVQSLGGEDPLEEENGNPLQYSCLENPMDRGAWQTTDHGVKELKTTEQLKSAGMLVLLSLTSSSSEAASSN